MAVYYTTKCPYCGEVYERRKDNANPYGSPFKTCRYCKKDFVDPNYIEIGLYDTKEIKECSFSWGAIFLIIFGIVLLATTWGEGYLLGIVMGIGLITFGIFNIIYNLRWNPDEDKDLQKQIEASRHRLSDPNYVIALWKNDCSVTPELVAWAKKELETKNPQADVFEKAETTDTIIS